MTVSLFLLPGCLAPDGPATVFFSPAPATGAAPLTVDFRGDARGVSPYRLIDTDGKFRGDEEGTMEVRILRWVWDFGDGATAEGRDVIHLYADPGVYTVSLTAELDTGDSVSDTRPACITVTNSAPVADAGPDGAGPPGMVFALDGRGSSDPDGHPLSYAWSVVSRPEGSTAAPADPAAAQTTFVADVAGAYTARLVVNDGFVDSAADEANFLANRAPVADAGSDQAGLVGAVAVLDGTGSSDPDGDALTWQWTVTSRPAGSTAALSGATTALPSLIPDEAGEYVVALTVSDGHVVSEPDTMTLTAHRRPVADAGADQVVLLGTVAALDGTGSIDPDGAALSWAWSIVSRPAGSAAVLADAHVAEPAFRPDVAGEYVVRLVVSDGLAESAPDEVRVRANRAPVADAGSDRTVATGATVVLDGGGSGDPDGDAITYAWALADQPPGSAAQLSGATSRTPSFTADAGGVYVVRLVVNDGHAESAPDTVVITANRPPVANAGADQNVAQGDVVQLNGAASSDPDGDALTWAWTLAERPEGSAAVLANGGTATPSFTADAAGTYVAELVVHDGRVASAPDTVTVTAEAVATNQPPVADAGPDQVVFTFTTVTLDGTGSSDPDGDALTWSWLMAERPEGSAAVLSGAATATPGFETDAAGVYVITLTVNDGRAESAADSVTVTARAPGAPVVQVEGGLSRAVEEGGTLAIRVSATDPDGDVVSLAAAPGVENATFETSPAVAPEGTFTFNPAEGQAGPWVLSFTARDPLGLSDTKHVQIAVGAVNHPPTLSVPATVTVDEGKLTTIPLTASDPDGDVLTLTAAPLPDNSLFLPSTGTITFAPDFEQAGTYGIACLASDGELDSGEKVVRVTVRDVTVETGGEPAGLDLLANPAESPTLLTETQVSGVVNYLSELPEPSRIRSALITGMEPASGQQGATLSVTLTGMADGDYVTHFAPGVSQASFGIGTTVDGLAVTDTTAATATITIAEDAKPGGRSVRVQTGDETALAVLSFVVTPGRADVTGRVVDPDTGEAVAGAVVSVAGTDITTTTDGDGYYTLLGVPSGVGRLIINPPDHERREIDYDAGLGGSTDLGETETASTVYDASAPPSATVFSVVGRGLLGFQLQQDKETIKQAVRDGMILVGGDEAGVLDAYGNQLNPAVSGNGLLSLTAEGQEQIARSLQEVETFGLVDLLAGASFGLEWGGDGTPPTLAEWIEAIQERVDAAWVDPSAPENALWVLLFNQGRAVTPEPPVVSDATRFNRFQAFLFTSSLIAYGKARELEEQEGAKAAAGRFTGYWRGCFQPRAEWPRARVNEAVSQMNYAMMISTTVAMAHPVLGVAMLGYFAPDFISISNMLGALTDVPEPPEILDVRRSDAGVEVTFKRSTSEANNLRWDKYFFVYNLLHFERTGAAPRVVCQESLPVGYDDTEAVFIDPEPPESGSTFYAMSVSRRLQNKALTGAILEDNFTPWWGSAQYDSNDRLSLWRRQMYGVTSDYSNPGFYRADPYPLLGGINAIAVDMRNGDVYISKPGEGMIYKAENKGGALGAPEEYVAAGFQAPGQQGLAIDFYGDLYTDNAASDAMYGGRIFEFAQPDGAREFVGTINYFSQLLMFANPVVSGPMVFDFRHLYVWEDISREVRKVPVSEDWDPYRRTGKLHANLAGTGAGAGIDMEFKNDLYVLQSNQITRVTMTINPLTGALHPVLTPITIDEED